jgi:hypothetical protein
MLHNNPPNIINKAPLKDVLISNNTSSLKSSSSKDINQAI